MYEKTEALRFGNLIENMDLVVKLPGAVTTYKKKHKWESEVVRPKPFKLYNSKPCGNGPTALATWRGLRKKGGLP